MLYVLVESPFSPSTPLSRFAGGHRAKSRIRLRARDNPRRLNLGKNHLQVQAASPPTAHLSHNAPDVLEGLEGIRELISLIEFRGLAGKRSHHV